MDLIGRMMPRCIAVKVEPGSTVLQLNHERIVIALEYFQVHLFVFCFSWIKL